MDYHATVTLTKVLSQVMIHMEVRRGATVTNPGHLMWSYTELLDEEAHPEPQKWLVQHLMTGLESMP